MKAGLEQVMAGVVLAFFVGSLFFSLLHLASGMTMDGSMSDCPYMSHEAALCPMNLLDHIDAWKASFVSIAPTFFTLAGLLMFAIVAASVAPNLLRKVRVWLLKVTIHRHPAYSARFIVRPLQELFSNGILHPKLF